MVKIVAIRSIFATKNSPKCFCGPGPMEEFPQTPSRLGSGERNTLLFPPLLDAFSVSILSVFGASTLESRRLDTLPR